MLSVSGLTISRGERVLIRDLTFGVASGEVVALTGANGAGKTSLLRALAGFLRPDAGTVAYEGVELSEARRRHLHWQGPLDGLKSGRRAGDELAFQARYAGADADGIAAAVDLLALTPLLDLEVRQLSAGQKRRLALARLIAAPRPLWLLDEPLSPLDARWRAVMGTLIQAHIDKGGAVIAAVHDPLPVPARTLDLGGGR
ncbi:MAG: heme ABC exporter ATP-binding protein CcmA [Brevundimonas sp.]|uniref:heme ABC exporter ATP-binding protein CcmA n=1 Tax=Brevundimonas sp. TaxID=1871086 RepID=UPI001A31EBA6|nr:heme ABC exporter ATP-binding protein CcmA [Brevundimonas sp.]MBJ7448644.1 heme ABC exporter ATP-binding protein CcmA [Brevundimonas sp.]